MSMDSNNCSALFSSNARKKAGAPKDTQKRIKDVDESIRERKLKIPRIPMVTDQLTS